MASAPRQQHRQQQPQQPRRVLRIGVILGGKIVEEKLVRERSNVSIGQSAKNTFAVPVDGLPRTWPLFVIQDDRYSLHFTDAMDGRLSEGSEVKTLASMKGRQAQKRGEAWVLPLTDSARGKLVVGEMTLLFQFVTEPPRQPRPHLPASVRGTFADRIDPMLSIILAISILLHFSVGLYAYQRDRVVKTRTTRIFNETFQRPTVAVAEIQMPTPRLEDDSKSTEAPATDTEPTQPERRQTSEPRATQDDSGPRSDRPGRSPEEALRLQEEARALALDLMTGGFSDTALDRGGGDRDPKHDLNAVIDEIKRTGTTVSDIGGGSGRGTRGDGDTRIGTSRGPEVEGPGETTSRTETRTSEKIPRGRINMGRGTSDDDTTLRPDAVLSAIRTKYMAALQRCHQDLLKRDPRAGGTVALRFTVGPSGRVTRVRARGFDAGVDKCIEARAKSWRFGVPKDSGGDPTDATFQVSLALQAN